MCSVPYKNNLLIAYWLSFQEAQHWVCLNASVCDVEIRKYLYVLYYKKCCSCISEWRRTEVTQLVFIATSQITLNRWCNKPLMTFTDTTFNAMIQFTFTFRETLEVEIYQHICIYSTILLKRNISPNKSTLISLRWLFFCSARMCLISLFMSMAILSSSDKQQMKHAQKL